MLKDRQVLDDGGERHVERLGKFADRGGAAGKAIDHEAPARIRQGMIDEIEPRGLVKHFLKYCRCMPIVKGGHDEMYLMH